MDRKKRTLMGLALLLMLGCQQTKHQLACEFPEEYTLPPDEPRFNNPPESGYKAPANRRDKGGGPGGPGGLPANMGGGGMGGMNGGMNGGGIGGAGGGGFSSNGVPGY